MSMKAKLGTAAPGKQVQPAPVVTTPKISLKDFFPALTEQKPVAARGSR